MDMPVTGMLREGSIFQNSVTLDFLFTNCSLIDGIHIDMEHLKHGEVKYFPLFPKSEITTKPSTFHSLGTSMYQTPRAKPTLFPNL